MISVAIVGGKLQGTESVALAKLAGFHSILVDKNPLCPASTLADEFICGDICARDARVVDALERADFVLPAMENQRVLDACVSICREKDLKLAFDPDAYQITSSKILSDELMHAKGVPAPKYYPDCSGPFIIKPSGESGSAGVTKVSTKEDVASFFSVHGKGQGWIAQEYLEGPSYSIEVIGNGKEYRTYTVTEIHMDDLYDCCKVTAMCPITEEQEEGFRLIGQRLAKLVKLKGIMDVEVIDDHGQFKVLEIDARIPSQTPLVVYYSSGVNLLEQLADVTLHGEFTSDISPKRRWVCYEHYVKTNGRISQIGEHIMGEASPLSMRLCEDPCDMVIIDEDKRSGDFKGIYITSADSSEELEVKRKRVLL